MLQNSIVPIEFLFPDKKMEQSELEEDTELNFLELRDLSESRKIERYGKNFNELRIEIFGDEYPVWEEYKPINICIVRIILDNHYTDEQKLPYEVQNPLRENRTELRHSVNQDSFDLFFDRANGELYPISSTIPMSKIFKKEAYAKFKYTITKLVLEYLQGKKEDLPQFLKKIQEKEEAEEKIARLEAEEKAKIKAALKEQYAYKKDPQQEDDIQEKEPEQTEESEKTSSSVYKRFVNGKRLRRALEILLGPPKGQTGSHIKFKSKKDGNNYPIAIHPGTDVGIGLLTKCLKDFGITPEELEEVW
jgi:predicted RNA binding protein YcfA (HicA-like mRNA interferase family)